MDNPAELFEAISHPTRIKILKILENEPLSFASLKRQLDISSSGNLDHHLKKLGQLITMQKDGLYGLTDAGKEALVSVGAIEVWKETEHRKIKTSSKLPKEVIHLAVMESAVAIAALLLLWFKFPDGSWPLFPQLLAFVFLTGFFSAVGLLKRKSWGWTLTVIQAATALVYMIFPLKYTIADLLNTHDMFAIEQISLFIPRGVMFVILGTVETSILFIALRRNIKEFFEIQNATPPQRRTVTAGKLVILGGLLEVFGGALYFYSPHSSFSLAWIGFLTGIVIVLGGIAILMQKYTLGGLITIGFCFLPLLNDIQWIIGTSVCVMSIVAVLLIQSNLKTSFSEIWRNLNR